MLHYIHNRSYQNYYYAAILFSHCLWACRMQLNWQLDGVSSFSKLELLILENFNRALLL